MLQFDICENDTTEEVTEVLALVTLCLITVEDDEVDTVTVIVVIATELVE